MTGHTSMLETIVMELRQESELRKAYEAQNNALHNTVDKMQEQLKRMEERLQAQETQSTTVYAFHIII